MITLQEQKFISMRVEPELKQMGIQYGLHYEKSPNLDRSIIVLECIPFENIKAEIKNIISEIIKDFPSRRTKTNRNIVTKGIIKEPAASQP